MPHTEEKAPETEKHLATKPFCLGLSVLLFGKKSQRSLDIANYPNSLIAKYSIIV